jgi:putative peptidoglycan lipid II flippase
VFLERQRLLGINGVFLSFKGQSRMGRHAFSTVAAGSLGVIAGVLLDMIVVAVFGMSWRTDAYFIAVTIPLVIITLMMLQATRVVQPLFINKRQTEGEHEGWNYLNLIMTGGTAIVAGCSAVGVLISPLIMRLQAAGSPSDETVLATRLSMCLFLILPLNFPVVIMRAALQSFGIFALPGSMKFFESSFKILLLLSVGGKLGVEALVWGTLAGTLFEVVVFYLVLRAKGFRFHAVFRLKHPDIVQAYTLMLFPLAGQACAVGVESLANALGSMLGPGNVTALRLATRIIESFAGLLVGSIVIAAMPAIAESVAIRDWKAMRKHLQHGLYLLLLVSIPFSIWLAMVSRPLISLLYERANFSAADTTLVANILLVMIPYLFLGRFGALLELPFFAWQDTKTPVLNAIVSAVLFVAISFFLVRVGGVYGIPIARSLGYALGAWLLLHLLRRHTGKIGFAAVRDVSIRICGASLIMAVFIWVGKWLAASIPLHGFVAKGTALVLPTAFGSVTLILSLFALRVLDPALIQRGWGAMERRTAGWLALNRTPNSL